ncbi:hypothetical protein [Streptomyces evansiae]|nr:hypothetical protein [Streptomyces sp. DSM 41859]MDT0425206.1 hypothetical protein [Streptomyces sp. DSM 41859]
MKSVKPSATNDCPRTSRAPCGKLKRLVKLDILTEADAGSFTKKQ